MPLPAFAQSAAPLHTPGMTHPMRAEKAAIAKEQPTEPGPAAFATIQEIIAMLKADATTDWTKVNIEALRQHLIDMDNVTLRALVTGEPVEGDMRFDVSGAGAMEASICAMTAAYAATMNGVDGWRFAALEIPGGAAPR